VQQHRGTAGDHPPRRQRRLQHRSRSHRDHRCEAIADAHQAAREYHRAERLRQLLAEQLDAKLTDVQPAYGSDAWTELTRIELRGRGVDPEAIDARISAAIANPVDPHKAIGHRTSGTAAKPAPGVGHRPPGIDRGDGLER
jgi:hypothetical protein